MSASTSAITPPISLPAGMTLRGNRRGINFGPQLYFSYQSFWQGAQIGRQGSCLFASCMLEIHGDYVRVTGLRMRGENRSTDTNAPVTAAIGVSWPGVSGPFFSVATTTQFISTIDHNDGSDWGVAVVDVNGPYILNQNADICSITYQSISNQYTQSCTSDIQNPAAKGFLTVADDAATLANAHVARNFLHHNERDSGGYGVVTSEGGRAFVEGNTFVSNRHDIASDGEPHNEYRTAHNPVLGNSPEYSSCFLFFCHYYATIRTSICTERKTDTAAWQGSMWTSSETPFSAPTGKTTGYGAPQSLIPIFMVTFRLTNKTMRVATAMPYRSTAVRLA